jgi:hypothetical protein
LIQVKAPVFEVGFAVVEPWRVSLEGFLGGFPMTVVTDNAGTSPRSRGVAGWLRTVLARLMNRDELHRIDRAEFDQIARDLNLSPFELHKLSIGNGSSPDLLKKRLAEFDLAPETVKREHPEVMRDLERVCGMCSLTKRCANEFASRAPSSSRSNYCPNTQTLQALERANSLSNAQAFVPIGPSCC